MKKLIYLLPVILYMSCSGNKENISHNNFADTTNKIIEEVHEEVYFDNNYFKIIDIEYNEFQTELKKIGIVLPHKEENITSTDYNIENDALKKCKVCKRIDNNTLKIGDKMYKNTVEYIDGDTALIADSYTSYFLYDYTDGLAFIKVHYYESGGNIVYVTNTRQEINMWGYPIYLPGKKAMFVANMDLAAQFEYNGLQFFIQKNGKWTKAWEQETDFGLQELHKINDSVIYAERVEMNFSDNNDMNYYTHPVKIIIK